MYLSTDSFNDKTMTIKICSFLNNKSCDEAICGQFPRKDSQEKAMTDSFYGTTICFVSKMGLFMTGTIIYLY